MLVPCYWYVYFFIIYHAWPTLRGRWSSVYFHVTTCHYFRLISCILPFNTCISLGNCVITCLLDMPLFGKTHMLYHDLPRLIINLLVCLLLDTYHHLSCYHLTPSMISLTCDYHLYGNLTYYSVPWSVTCFPALHAVTWLYIIYALQISWSCPFPAFPVKW